MPQPAIVLIAWLLCLTLAQGGDEQSAADLLAAAVAAFEAGKTEEALELAGQAIAADAQSTRPLQTRARMYAALRKPAAAVADLGRAIALAPNDAELYNARGAEQFKQGNIGASIADFDHFIQLKPGQERSHWMRGISYYYAGRYDLGVKQFEGYQTFDDNDVENAVWRYLCMARSEGLEKARQSILKIKQDPRVPMMQIYALYAGEGPPDDVLQAAQAGNPQPRELNARLFYAHLYLGLYYEAAGDPQRALTHIGKAADDHKIGHYMWDVAHVHAQRLRSKRL